MKEILKKALIPIFLSVICGFLCGRVVYNIYLDKTDLTYENNLLYLVQSGAYSSYDSMRANAINYNYIYYEEDNLFKTIIGITKNKSNIDKIKSVYDGEVIINKYYINNGELNKYIKEYDDILSKEEDSTKIKEIVIEMLNLYKGEDNNKLIRIS